MQDKRKKNIIIIRILLIFFMIITLLQIMTTYAKYTEKMGTNFKSNIKKWLIEINENDIIENNTLEEYLEPKIVPNENSNQDVIVPGSIGYFDVILDYSKVDVNFEMKYDFLQTNENLNDDFRLMGYYITNDVTNSEYDISGIDLDNDLTNLENNTLYSYNTFNTEYSNISKIRILFFFEWNDRDDNNLTNEQDTAYQVSETKNDKSIIKYRLKFKFKQDTQQHT